jgi:hypothetical protein
MSCEFIAGFEEDDLTSVGREWVLNSAAGAGAITMPYEGPRGRKCIKFGNSSNSKIVHSLSNLAATAATVGFRFKVNDIANGSTTGGAFCRLYANDNRVSFELSLELNNAIKVIDDSGHSWYGESLLLPNTWYYLEMLVKRQNIDGGSMGVYLNGSTTPDGPLYEGDTMFYTTSSMSQVQFQGMGGLNWWLADVYVLNSISSKWGDTKVTARIPDGAGTYSGLSVTAGSTYNYQAVDDGTTDDGISYVYGQSGKDTYTFPALGYTALNIRAASIRHTARVLDATPRTLTTTVRSGVDATPLAPADNDHGTLRSLSQNWVVYPFVFENNPRDSNPWTQTDLEAAEFGPKVA